MGAKKKRTEKQAPPSLRPCDRAAVAYRSEDPLENLKIRVQLKSLSGPAKASADEPQPEREPQAEEANAEEEGAENEADAGDEGGEADEDAEPEPVRWALPPYRARL